MSTSSLASFEDHAGGLYWPAVHDVARQTYLNADTVQLLKERLKSEATHIVLNTFTALHTISLNGSRRVRDQLALSKCMKHLERLLNRPPFPGVEMAAAQLLIDWAFLFGAEDLGDKSFHLLTNTSKHRAMIQGMQASDVAVMLREDQRLGMPRFVSVVKGLDFGRQFATQFASPLTGAAEPPSVLSRLAAAAVAASYSGSSAAAAAAAAASRNTFAAWAERVQGDPPAAAQQVLSNRQQVESDIAALSAAQAAVLAAARPFLAKGTTSSSSSSSLAAAAAAAPNADYSQLRHELDRAYLVACKVTEWREMIQVLVQQQLPDTQLSSLLSLADVVNATLEEWTAAATTELFWLLGVNTAGLADGSLLGKIVPAATGGAAAAGGSSSAAAAAAAAGQQTGGRQQQQTDLQSTQGSASFTTRSSYLDLLTGDALPPSSNTNNPFLSNISRGSTNPASSTAQAALAPGRGITDTIPPEVQSYIQETAARPAELQYSPAAAAAAAAATSTSPVAAAAAAFVAPQAAAAAGYPVITPVSAPAVSTPPAAAAALVGVGVQPSGLYPAVRQPQQYTSPPQQQQPQQQLPSYTGTASTMQQQQQQYSATTQVQELHQQQAFQQPGNSSGFTLPSLSPSQQQQQQQAGTATSTLPPAAAAAAVQCSGSSMAAGSQPVGAGSTGPSSISSTGHSFSSISKPVSTDQQSSILCSGDVRNGASAVTAAAAGGAGGGGGGLAVGAILSHRSSNSAAAGDTGSSADSAAGSGFSYINPFASLDTGTIMSSLKSAGRRSSVDGATPAAAAAAAATSSDRIGGKSRSIDSGTAAGVPLTTKTHSCGTDTVGDAGSGASSTTAVPRSPQHQQQQSAPLKKREPPPPPQAAAAAVEAAAAGATGSHMATAAVAAQNDHAVHHVPQQLLQSSSSSSITGLHDIAAAATADAMGQQQQQHAHHTLILQPQQVELLQQKLTYTISTCGNSSSSGKCQVCSMPDIQGLQSSVLQLLIQQQQEFEGRLQQLQRQHQKEVAELKATAIRKFKELQQELEQAKQQHQQHTQ